MIYLCRFADGDGKRSKSLAELRMYVASWLSVQEGNMEIGIPIFQEDGKVAEIVYLKFVHDICFLVSYRAREKRTYRSYYPVDDVIMDLIRGNKPENCDWIEILTMRGKQMCMTGGLGT